MDFTKHIKRLLILNDKLTLPGLGTFITRYKPAEMVPGMNYMKPPSKEVTFDQEIHKIRRNDLTQFEGFKTHGTYVWPTVTVTARFGGTYDTHPVNVVCVQAKTKQLKCRIYTVKLYWSLII